MSENQRYEKIGNMFRQARESIPVDLDRVSRDLYIRARYLRSLEAGKFHELPGPAYVKGYLLAYAHYLHMDEQEILRQFHAIEADFRRSHYFPKVLGDDKNVRGWMIFVGLMLVVSAVGLWMGSYYMQ
ncbi:MAG: helix-turn-helix domain-containing protein, partial [Alphaproteobacteria bacterium]